MKAKDLMIGDWVNYHDDDKIVPKQVSEITDFKQLQLHDKDNWIIVGEKYCEPIPLTAEILEKNGFKYDELPKFAVNEITEKTKMTFSYHSGSRTVFVGVSEPNFNLTSACVLYVHELQHILRQSRIEKEIIL